MDAASSYESDAARIVGLEKQVQVYQDRIADLQRREAEDKRRIAALEAKAASDRDIIAALTEQGVLDRTKIANLQMALTSSRRIGAAMGILMAREGLTDEQAFDRLRVASQNGNRKLREVADDVLYTGVLDQQ